MAAEKGFQDLCKLLLNCGANIEQKEEVLYTHTQSKTKKKIKSTRASSKSFVDLLCSLSIEQRVGAVCLGEIFILLPGDENESRRCFHREGGLHCTLRLGVVSQQ